MPDKRFTVLAGQRPLHCRLWRQVISGGRRKYKNWLTIDYGRHTPVLGDAPVFSISCSIATTASDLGGSLIFPAVLLITVFILAIMFGPGRGQISSLIDTVAWFFGNRWRIAAVAIILLLGGLGAGLIAGAAYLGPGCGL
jgi:hypothetical protein